MATSGVKLIAKAALAAVLASFPQAAHGQDAAPGVADWVESVAKRASTIADNGFPFKIVIVTDLGEKGAKPKIPAIDRFELEELVYFRLVDTRTVEWNYTINKSAFAEMDPIEALLHASQADTVLLAPEKGKWEFLRWDKGKRKVLLGVEGAKSHKPSDIAAWLPEALGWDGIVLAAKGDYLLVGSTAGILVTPEIQALAVAGSTEKLSLDADRKGSGLLSLSQNKGAFGVFDVVFLGQDLKRLPVGTKLIIEKKKK